MLSKVSAEIFLETYLQQVYEADIDFLSQVELFKARTSLSICYYLIKVGLGGSENLWRVLVEAGRILTHLQVKSMGERALLEQKARKTEPKPFRRLNEQGAQSRPACSTRYCLPPPHFAWFTSIYISLRASCIFD